MSKIDGKKIIELKRLIVDLFDKSDWIELGYLLNSGDVVEKHPRLLRSLDFGDEDYEGNVLQVLNILIGDSPSKFDEIQEYISNKKGISNPENSELISTYQGKKVEKNIIFSPDPEIFKIPDKKQDNNLVSVMMPFHAGLDKTIESIRNSCKKLGIDCKRADDIWDNSTFIQDIFDLIFISKVVIADFTGKNPNVFYEVGIAHALGKSVIPITQSIDDVPTDLRHHRVLKYLPNGEGFIALESDLEKRLKVLFPEANYYNF